MRLDRSRFLAAAGAFGAVTALRYPGNAAEFTYKVGCNTALTHPITIRAREAAQIVHEKSGGRFDIQVFPNSSLGTDTSMLAQLRAGALEFEMISNGILANVVPAAGIDGVDFIFADAKQAYAVVDGPLGLSIHAALEKAGIHPFSRSWDAGFKQIMSSRPIEGPDDLRGLKLRIAPNPAQVAVFKSFGSSPVPMNLAELYTGLQTHLVDGAELALSSIEDGKYFEVSKYLAITNHTWVGYSVISNQASFRALPPNLRDLVESTFNAAGMRERADVAKDTATLVNVLRSQGMTVARTNFKAFQNAVKKAGLFTTWRDNFGADSWALLEKSIGQQLA